MVANKVVVVASVVVERPSVARPRFAFVPKRLVDEAVVANDVVEVAFVVVELRAVKFCRVDDPVVKIFENVPRPVEVILPTELIAVAKRLVEDAVVANDVVEVALVVVEFNPVKFWRVDEPLERRFPKVPRPVANMVPAVVFTCPTPRPVVA